MLQVCKEKMQAALSPDMLATDLAYYLVRKGVSRSSCCDNAFLFQEKIASGQNFLVLGRFLTKPTDGGGNKNKITKAFFVCPGYKSKLSIFYFSDIICYIIINFCAIFYEKKDTYICSI